MDRESHDELTGTQRRVLNFIVGRIESTQQWPTFLEISEEFGWSSPNSAAAHVDALERKGWVGRLDGQRSRRYCLARHSVEVRELRVAS